MATTRMYLVESDFGSKHLVEAPSQAAAIRAIVGPRFTASIPSPKDVVQLMHEGIDVIVQTDDIHHQGVDDVSHIAAALQANILASRNDD